jgi:hypothetical protein
LTTLSAKSSISFGGSTSTFPGVGTSEAPSTGTSTALGTRFQKAGANLEINSGRERINVDIFGKAIKIFYNFAVRFTISLGGGIGRRAGFKIQI